jgi:succinate-acetate transporter protein
MMNTDPEADPDRDPPPRELWPRILWIVVITAMISVAQSVLFAVAALQVLIMIVSKGKPNEELGDFGAMIGAWIAKAARYQAAASDVKPWPWTPMGS